MLRISPLLAVLAVLVVSLAACTASVPDDASLSIGNDVENGNVEIQFGRTDPDHQLGVLSASINGIAIDSPIITSGGCASTDNDPLGGGCSGPYATYEISPGAFGNAVAADVSVTEGDETFHYLSPEFFVPRVIAVQTPLDQPLAAGGTVVVSDGAATDQIQGWLLAYTPTTSCFTVDAHGAGSISFDLDPADFDSSCGAIPAGTIVDAHMDVTLQVVPAQTCDGPENLSCGEGDPSIDQTIAMQLQF